MGLDEPSSQNLTRQAMVVVGVTGSRVQGTRRLTEKSNGRAAFLRNTHKKRYDEGKEIYYGLKIRLRQHIGLGCSGDTKGD